MSVSVAGTAAGAAPVESDTAASAGPPLKPVLAVADATAATTAVTATVAPTVGAPTVPSNAAATSATADTAEAITSATLSAIATTMAATVGHRFILSTTIWAARPSTFQLSWDSQPAIIEWSTNTAS